MDEKVQNPEREGEVELRGWAQGRCTACSAMVARMGDLEYDLHTSTFDVTTGKRFAVLHVALCARADDWRTRRRTG